MAVCQVFVAGDEEDDDAEQEISSHSRDMSFHKRAAPGVVVYPASAEEVQAVVKAAYDANVPVVPRGAGSGLEGGAIPYQVNQSKCQKRVLHFVALMVLKVPTPVEIGN